MPQKIPDALPVSNEAVALFSSVPGEEVADYTEQVNRLYFEAGFALGLGLLVIPTCRENQIGKLHFDSPPQHAALENSRRFVSQLDQANFGGCWCGPEHYPRKRECRTSLVEARGYYCVASKGLRGE